MTHPTSNPEMGSSSSSPAVAVAICGSFRRDVSGLRAAHKELIAAGAVVLSPVDPEFVHEEEGFVFAANELGETASDIEARHIGAMVAADFVWLHAPQGYVGTSAAMELGVAHALGLPIYARNAPSETVLSGMVTMIDRPADAVASARVLDQDAPTRALAVLQEYYRRAAARRGWADETPQETLLLLTEEVGELSRALRKTRNGRVPAVGENPALELADVALYTVHLANVLSIDLGDAVLEKERVNAARFSSNAHTAAA